MLCSRGERSSPFFRPARTSSATPLARCRREPGASRRLRPQLGDAGRAVAGMSGSRPRGRPPTLISGLIGAGRGEVTILQNVSIASRCSSRASISRVRAIRSSTSDLDFPTVHYSLAGAERAAVRGYSSSRPGWRSAPTSRRCAMPSTRRRSRCRSRTSSSARRHPRRGADRRESASRRRVCLPRHLPVGRIAAGRRQSVERRRGGGRVAQMAVRRSGQCFL